MNKLLIITVLTAITNIAYAASGGVDVGFKSKLLDQGVVTGVNFITASANVEVASFGLGVDTYSAFERSDKGASSGIFKRVDVTASYNFTSSLADLTLGATYKNASKTAAFNRVKDNVATFVKLHGNAFKALPWDVTLSNDIKNRTNNIEGNLKLPIPVGVKGLKFAPSVGLGFNDPGSTTIAALKGVKKYGVAGAGATYAVLNGELYANGYVHRPDLTSNYGQVTSYDAGYRIKF